MSVIAAYAYKNGVRTRQVSLSQPASLQPGDDDFVWIGLLEPKSAELVAVKDAYGLHPIAVEHAFNTGQLPKAEVYGDQLFVLAKTAHLENDKITYGQTAMFVGPRHIVTVRHGSARAHTELRAQLEAAPKLLGLGTDYILHALLDYLVDGYMPIVERIEEEVLHMERRALDAFLSRGEVQRLFHLRQEMMRFARVLAPMKEMAKRLEQHDHPCIDANVRPYFHDVADRIQRVSVLTNGVREAIASVFEASSLLEQQRQSAITRQLAAWAAILAVPTAIAGIYGMNFDFMPELRVKYAYFVVLGLVLAICLALYARFKRSGWL